MRTIIIPHTPRTTNIKYRICQLFVCFPFPFPFTTRVCYLSSIVCLLLLQHYPYRRLVVPAQHLWTSQKQLVMLIFLHFAFNHNHSAAHAHGKDRKDRCVSLTSLRLILVVVVPMCT